MVGIDNDMDKIANHPLLVRRIYSDEDVKVTLDKVVGELKNYSDFSIHRCSYHKKMCHATWYICFIIWLAQFHLLIVTIIDTFNNDTSIFACLLSTRAGEQGLNLVGADTVVIHDMDFNPQIDRQAEDHCHCIGQVKVVTIYRLVTKGTIDENVYEIAERK
ncbi:hypothetical protein DVH24_015345 [Malus domestica]|uniref:Helicase C-terminal domain-containing protein n=1 Tax=Malus domestica TaxID=3750 RepID=A0A498K3L7_MALDO|nr:hypothetical protein DVH24_015345 [Malus domestica]